MAFATLARNALIWREWQVDHARLGKHTVYKSSELTTDWALQRSTEAKKGSAEGYALATLKSILIAVPKGMS